ncbi:CHAD domain-containing protein [Pseudaminobacter sp. 19-2017]|uniref:CHAD domain-containing protein n=2 Tax=Pseudaminobacter soli (ex Zhang et al. 2022) TaxID=2831468 RepID=A0A942DYU3_9HYPH|nr:CHAD domain-containing protein [Pseudaminobacter soli]
MTETELKFVLDEASSHSLWQRAVDQGLANAVPRPKDLYSIYFDTPDHALGRAGTSLRVRRDGRRWVQTVKTRAEMYGGLSEAREIEAVVPDDHVDLEAIADEAVREQVRGWVKDDPLQPICETRIRRTAGKVRLTDGTCAELAVDVGEIRASGRADAWREAEFELLEGRPAGLFALARKLMPEVGVRFSRFSKAARGYMLAEEGRIEPPLAARNAKPIKLNGEETTEQAFRAILRECFDQIAENVQAVLELDDSEGPHQLRVGLRRLRTAFAVFASVVESPVLSRLGDEARWLGHDVGGLRDLDVVADDVVRREADAHQDEPGLLLLAGELASIASERREALRTVLRGQRTQEFLLDLACYIETNGWRAQAEDSGSGNLDRPVSEVAADALEKSWKRVRKRAGGVEDLTTEQRHDLRKALKRLRYAVEFFAALYRPKRVQPFLRRLKVLQDMFGHLNDAEIVRRSLSGAASPPADDVTLQRGIGWMLGVTHARAEIGWAETRAAWERLEETKPFWRYGRRGD